MKKGKAEGMAQGMTKGANEEKIRSAKAMKDLSLPIETIARITGLSIEEIAKL